MTTSTNDDNGRRILVFGSPKWTSRALTLAAFKRVMQVYVGPYTLVTDMSDGAGRFAAAIGRELGWRVEAHEYDPMKCGADCPTTNHRRSGGPLGDFCPTARQRNLDAMADLGADLAIYLGHSQPPSGIRRDSNKDIKLRGIGLWEYIQPGKAATNGN